MSKYCSLAERVIAGEVPNAAEALAALQCSDHEFPDLFSAAARVRSHYFGQRVGVQVLSNAKSGLCSEDCHYCSQSRVSQADIARYALKSKETLLAEARRANSLHARRFCMGLSGRVLSDAEIDELADVVSTIKADTGLPLCCSLGFLTPEQAQRLRGAGLDRINHNLNTSERFYPSICTSHSFADRMRNLKTCREAGLEICSGGIVGQGESDQDIVDMLLALREIAPDSVPINFLIPIEGTPFARLASHLTPLRCLKILAVARLIHPTVEIRVAGGREYHLRTLQPMALFLANSIFANGYLTETGQAHDEAIQMIEDLGFEIEMEHAASLQA